MARIALAVIVLTGLASTAFADDEVANTAGPPATEPRTVCELIDESAAAHDLPVEFLTRLVWKESRFKPNAVSPKGAQGIAQFMPGTAALRGLADPFDPTQAIPAAALYLHDLSGMFGNLGLAAGAYNAGEKRVTDWLAGDGGLPWETRDYVYFITGRTAEDWKAVPEPTVTATPPGAGLAAGLDVRGQAATACTEVAALLSKPGAGSALASRLPSAPWAPWGVQVAGNFSEARALASYARLQGRFPSLLADRAPLILRTVNRSRGAALFTQVRIPADTREEAENLCADLTRAGGACVVLKN